VWKQCEVFYDDGMSLIETSSHDSPPRSLRMCPLVTHYDTSGSSHTFCSAVCKLDAPMRRSPRQYPRRGRNPVVELIRERLRPREKEGISVL
jgi:hypothetical protein